MRIKDMNWMQVEDYLKKDNRAVLPTGSTEQHAQLSLMVDCILSERVAVDAAKPTGVPVFPPVNYGITPYFRAFPGTISLKMDTYLKVITDVLDCMYEQGFRRILIVNGHGGNSPAMTLAQEWMVDYDRMKGMGPKDARRLLGDGNFGGYYEKSDTDMMALWDIAVEETRTLIETGWQ